MRKKDGSMIDLIFDGCDEWREERRFDEMSFKWINYLENTFENTL